jgi:hypothetical protein
MAIPPQLLIMLAQEVKKQKQKVWQKTDDVLRNTVAPAVSTTAGMINMYNDQSENPDVGTGMWSGALQHGAAGYQSGGLRGLIGGGVLGGITSGLSTLNRAEQKSISDENVELNKMYGSMVGDDADLQMLLHGKTGGEVTSSDPENQSEFIPIQAEARIIKSKGKNGKIISKLVKEKLAFADGKISSVNADKPHSEMSKDKVTDVVKAGTYVFPVFTKLNKKDLNSLVSYGQGNYEENSENFEISEIRLKDILGEDFEGSFAEAADIIDKKYPLSDVEDRTDRISVATNNDNTRNRMLYINHLIRLNEAKLSGEEVEDMTISPEKSVRKGGYIRIMKMGGMVNDPPKKKPYPVSWSNSSSGAAEVKPVGKSEYATRESRETYKDNNRKQADIDDRANTILKTKKPGEFSDEEIGVINSSTLKNKDIIVGDDNIAKANVAQQKDDAWTPEGFKNSTQAVGDKFSMRRLPMVGEYIPGFFDVTKGLGDMASGLGEIPYDVQQGNYGAAAGKVALPLAVGALGGIGAKNTGQFVNNMVNPFAGIFPWKTNKDRIRVNKRFDIYRDELPELMSKHKNEFEQKYGLDYDEKDLGLFAKLKEIENRRLRKVEEPDFVKEKTDEFVKKHNPNYKFDKKGEVLVDAYTHGYDSKINKRSDAYGNSKFYEDVVIPELENIILKNKLKDVQRFYRGTDDHIAQVERNGETISIPFHQLQKGDIYIPKSFTSTSISDNIAKNFGSHLVEIDAPKGQSYLFAGKAPSNSFKVELETVLPKDLRFIVDDIDSEDLQKIRDMSEMKEGHVYSTGHMKKDGNYYLNGELIDEKGVDFLKNKLPSEINNNIAKKRFKFSIDNPYAMVPLYMAMNKLMKEKENKVNVYDTKTP